LLELNADLLAHLKDFFRNGLAHAGITAPNVVITPEKKGKPFWFENNVLVGIRLPALCHVVKAGWSQSNQRAFHSQLRLAVMKKAAGIAHAPGSISTMTPAASGVWKKSSP